MLREKIEKIIEEHYIKGVDGAKYGIYIDSTATAILKAVRERVPTKRVVSYIPRGKEGDPEEFINRGHNTCRDEILKELN